jgi:hypothetical protein
MSSMQREGGGRKDVVMEREGGGRTGEREKRERERENVPPYTFILYLSYVFALYILVKKHQSNVAVEA